MPKSGNSNIGYGKFLNFSYPINLIKELEENWKDRYPMVINSWKNNWNALSAYFEYFKPIRRIIYTTQTMLKIISQRHILF